MTQIQTGPKRCEACKEGYIISTKRYGENIFVDRCSNCGKVYNEYKIEK